MQFALRLFRSEAPARESVNVHRLQATHADGSAFHSLRNPVSTQLRQLGKVATLFVQPAPHWPGDADGAIANVPVLFPYRF